MELTVLGSGAGATRWVRWVCCIRPLTEEAPVPAHPSTPADRVAVGAHLLAHEGEYGLVAALGRTHAVSRPTLYAWRERSRAGVVTALTPGPRGPAPAPAGATLARAILTLLVRGHASYRGIQECLRELLGWRVGLGTIATIVAEAGERAQAVLAGLTPAAAVVLAVDECFGAGHQAAYLSAVDARTWAVWGLTGPVGPDARQWADLLAALAGRGVTWTGAVHDGGKAAAGGVAQATPGVPRQRDLWHVLYRGVQSRARLERQVREALARWEAAERYAEAVANGRRPRQRPPQPVDAAVERVTAVERAAADLRYLSDELHRLLGVVVVEHGRRRDLAARRADLGALLELLAGLAETAPAETQADLGALRHHLREALDGLLVFATELEPAEQAAQAALGPAAVDLLAWAWERRAVLGAGDALLAQVPASWRPAAARLLAAWEGAVRASSAVEGWHSLLRPHLAVHRTLSPGLLALLAVWHNHRVYARGAHAGQSPLRLSGLVDAPTDWLTALGYPPTVADPASPPRPRPAHQELPMAA